MASQKSKREFELSGLQKETELDGACNENTVAPVISPDQRQNLDSDTKESIVKSNRLAQYEDMYSMLKVASRSSQ